MLVRVHPLFLHSWLTVQLVHHSSNTSCPSPLPPERLLPCRRREAVFMLRRLTGNIIRLYGFSRHKSLTVKR
jgi:hypothetical protein